MSYVTYTLEGPVTDGTIVGPDMSNAYERGYISVIFFSDAFITSVLPTAGTLTFEASELGTRFGTVSNGTVTASADKYDRPSFSGSVTKVRAIALGITGALNYRASIHRFEG